MNMALDQAWLEHGSTPVLRVYTWDRPTVTIGYAQNLARVQEALPDWPVVRRLVDISSTDIRSRVAAGRCIRYLTPDTVCDYIATHGLYRNA